MTTITLNIQAELTLKGESEAELIRAFHRFLTQDMGDANHTLLEPTEVGGEWQLDYDAGGVVFRITFDTFRGLINKMLKLPLRHARFDALNYLNYYADHNKTEASVWFATIKNATEED